MAEGAFCLETSTFGLRGGGCSGLEDLFCKDLGGDGRKSGHAALEVVAAGDKNMVKQISRQVLHRCW